MKCHIYDTKLLIKQIITNMKEKKSGQWNVNYLFSSHPCIYIYVFMFQSKQSDRIVHFSIEIQRKQHDKATCYIRIICDDCVCVFVFFFAFRLKLGIHLAHAAIQHIR